MGASSITIIFCFFIFPIITSAQTIGTITHDYVWQDRFKNTLVEAKRGDINAQFKLGEMYEKGRGTPINVKRALKWYHKAASKFHLMSRYRLGYLYYNGIGVQVDKTKAYNFLKIPAQNGNIRAQYYLGRLFSSGEGVEKNAVTALSWYRRASLGGFYLAKKYLAENNTHTSNILKGEWIKGVKKPAEFLPSRTTECEKQVSSVVECLSGELNSNIGSIDITYVTKSLIFDIRETGNFKVIYRNKVLNVRKLNSVKKKNNAPEDDNVVFNMSVKLGWQDMEHKLECNIVDKNTIDCIKNKIHNIKFNNRQLETLSEKPVDMEHLVDLY